MTCPKCDGKTIVTDSVNANQNTTYRRKKCTVCGHIFYTAEFEVEQTEKLHLTWNYYYRRKRR